jgi:endonuclease III
MFWTVMYQQVYEETGACSLEHLRSLPDDEVKEYLARFKGVGAKTISCVLMFCLGRAEFPVVSF